jgi:glucokinase
MARRPSPTILAGDVGGTNARLRLYDAQARRVLAQATLSSIGAESLEAILGTWLAGVRAMPEVAVIGVAGPVAGGRVRTTNLPWLIHEREVERVVGIPRVRLVNDLVAMATGCAVAGAGSIAPLREGKAIASANRAVITAGTGLGEALLVWTGTELVASASEGGHASFSPRDDVDVALLAFLRERLAKDSGGHVSWERVVSGPGIGALYDFFAARAPRPEPVRNQRALAKGDRNAAITRLGLSGASEPARAALERFAVAYGAEAGNLVLKGLAVGGLYLTGRIAREIVPAFERPFLDAMADKGRMRRLLARVPVWLVRDDEIGISGAAHLAARLLKG